MRTENIEILIVQAKSLVNTDPKKAICLLEDAQGIARKSNDPCSIAEINFAKGNCFIVLNKFRESISSYMVALGQFRELNDNHRILECLEHLRILYTRLGDPVSALNYILESLQIQNGLNNPSGIAGCHNQLGGVYIHLQDYGSAIDHFRKALKISESNKNKKEAVNSYFLLGNAYNWVNDFEKSHYYLLRGINSMDQVDDIELKAKMVGSLAILDTKKKEYENALHHFNEALAIANTGAPASVRAQLYKSLGNLYIELTQFDKAIDVLNQALNIGENSPVECQVFKIHEFLSLAYEKLNDHKTALYHFKKYFELDKQLTSEEVNLKTNALYVKYELDELKKQKEIAELSDKMKEQFLANVSHEIRTPMNGVIGMAHLLNQTQPTPEQSEYIEAIKQSAGYLMAIINDILDFSKINSGKVKFTTHEFNLRELLDGVIHMLKTKADEKKIKFGHEIDPYIPTQLVGDPVRLNQIMMNLVGNAVKFTERGKVNVCVTLMEKHESQCSLSFRVTDTGIGIPEEKLQSIFESFEQIENTKKHTEGTGLGLTIVKQLVELQGGTVRVKSKVNAGSEFSFQLDFKLPEPGIESSGELPSLEIVPQNFSHVRVLIVEDNKINQLLVKNMLKKFGFNIIDCAENGKAALERLSENTYDIILMDIQMPGMDGHELTIEIRTNMKLPSRNIPIIALTADASDKEKARASESGMNDYVVKPFAPEELYSTILKYIGYRDKQDAASTGSEKSNLLKKKTVAVKNGMELGFLEKYTGGDSLLKLQLVEIFLKEVPESIEKLEVSVQKADWKEVHAVIHKVKSCISIFQLNDLKKTVLAIEERSRDLFKTDEVPALFLTYKTGCMQAIQDLREELKKISHPQE